MKGWTAAVSPRTIRGKLSLAFAVVGLTAIVGGLVSKSTYDVVEEKLDVITKTSVPSMAAAQRIAETTAQIAAAAPALHSASTEAALDTQRDQLQAATSRLQLAIAELAPLAADTDAVGKMHLLASEAAAMVLSQTDNVQTRLQLAQQSRVNLRALALEHQVFNGAIRPVIEAEKAKFLESSSAIIATTEDSVKKLNDMSMKGLLPILQLRVLANIMVHAAGVARTAMTRDEVDRSWQAFVAANSIATRQLGELQKNESVAEFLDIEPLLRIFAGLGSLGVGDQNVFDRQIARLAAAPPNSERGPAHDQFEARVATQEADLEQVLKVMITLIRGRTATANLDLKQYVSTTLDTMADEGLGGIGDLLKLEALGNRIVGLLTVAALLESDSELASFEASFGPAAAQFDAILTSHEAQPGMAAMIQAARHLTSFGSGERGVFAVRRAELQMIAEGERMLGNSLRLVEELTATAAQMVGATRTRSTRAADAAARSMATSWWALLGIGAAGVLILLSVWLYVHRSLGARLSDLSDSMLAIARGNLRAPLSAAQGSDEIAQMAQALSVFRDTAVEVEENNLREIATARQRLIDAIESTSEGFAFYDAADRLMLSNQRYRELLYDGGEVDLTPGTPFEAIIREAVERGLIEEAGSDPEGWIEQRLARHRDPGEAQLQRRSNGRWVQMSERRITGGGTAAVFTDLTELKESEQRAASANRLIMESLRYASRIQSAVLPARDALVWPANEHFLIWEPRDVVGGDFFWLQPAPGGYVVIVGDCTGHGVPGAFMTLIACGMLDRIWQTVPPDEPGKLLSGLHRALQMLLRQDQGEGDTDDGLEAGACFVSEAERRLVFAGARFSLWRANGGAVEEIKGDKAGIGYRRFAPDIRFNDVSVEISNGASFYLTTDGLIDQVGGPRHRSFGKRRFSAFVVEHQGRPMPEQAEALRQALAAYQGDQARRDDVTVLGFAPNAV